MFRNQKIQRSIAALVLTTFSTMTYSPLHAAETARVTHASTAPTPTINGAPLIPLQPRSTSGAITTSKGVTTITVGSPPNASKAAASTSSTNTNKPVTTPTTTDYTKALAQLAELAKQPVTGVAAAQAQVTALRTQYRIVQKYETQAAAAFAATDAQLRSKGIPAEILARHQAMVDAYTTRNNELKAVMHILDGATAANAQTALQQLAQLFAHYPVQTGQQQNTSASPTRLPWSNHKGTPRHAALTPREHETLFPRTVQIAAAGTLSGIPLPDATLGTTPQPEDLAETGDITLTAEIRALAASLSNNPVQIYQWVRNNIAYTPGYGAMQGAANTLQSKRGNAIDTASLLIALYRAAGTPARYVYGTIELPIARAQSWLAVDNAAAVQSLLTQAGIPNQTTPQAGQPSAIQLEHVWVQAYVDYTPSRGAINKTPDTWVPIDASFKGNQINPGLALRQAISLNEAGLFDAARQGAICSPDSAQTLNATAIQSACASYKTQLNGYLTRQGPDLTVGDVLGSHTIVPENDPILMGSLPYKTIAQGALINVLPDNLRWQLRYQLFADTASQTQGQPTVALSGSLASLAGKRITLSFTPATQADADTLASYMPTAHANNSPIQSTEFPADIPAYLIRVKAELRADGQLVSSGGSFTLGSELIADIASYDPASGNWTTDTNTPHAGDYQAIAIDVQGISAAQLAIVKNRLAATQAALPNAPNTLSRDDVTGDVLYHAALAYFATADANAAVFQRAAGTIEQRLPSYGRAIAPAQPQLVLGFVNKVTFPGVVLDIDRMNNAVAAKTGGLDAVAYTRQSNERNAAYAYLVLEKLFTNAQQPGEAVSAIKLLANAAQAQPANPVTALTSANIATLLPTINLTTAARTDVQNAVAAGYRVLVAQNPATIGAWNGQAIQIEDPVTGAGSYRIRGNNGGDNGPATAALYLQNGTNTGMGWLALAQPFQSAASITPTIQAGQATDDVLNATLDNANTTRWAYFTGQADVANGLFLARIAAAQTSQACDSLIGILAAKLDTTTGFENPPAPIATPTISSNPVTAGQVGQGYRYAVMATDPNNAALTYSVQGPNGMTVSNTTGTAGLISWDSTLKGSFTITVRADNGKAYAQQTYVLTIGADLIPLQLDLSVSPGFIDAGQSTTITVLTNGGSGTINKTLKIDGQPVALNAAGQATITATATGTHPIQATATDAQGTETRTSQYSVRNPADTTAPIAEITSPAEDTEITAPVNVTGTASDANLAYYHLLLRQAGGNDSDWQLIGQGTQTVTNGTLGKLDPTQMQNGMYELGLIVYDINGQTNSQTVSLSITRDLKIGQFSISIEDLNVETSGIPIRVTRTYDTRRKAQSLDFGYGWSIDYQNLQIRKNMVFGLQWQVIAHPLQLTLCIEPGAAHKINITLPTGKTERFTASNAQECGQVNVPPIDIRLTALPGTTSTLEIVDPPVYPDVQAQGGQLYDMVNQEPWNPKDFKLTTDDNYQYYLSEGIGITKIVDPSGNTLTYGQNGIVHSNGMSVAITRDANNRITGITDPSGKSIAYTYSTTGDLVNVTNRTNATSTFTYNRSHGLTGYTDPDGNVSARYVYDDDGRLIATYDAQGNAINTTHDTASNKEIVKDRRGNITTYTYDSNGNISEKIDALGNRTISTYDALGNETSTTDPLGKITTRNFDPQTGKQLTEKDPPGNTQTWTYDTTGRQLNTMRDARGNTTTFQYFGFGQAIMEPLGRRTGYVLGQGNNHDTGLVIETYLEGHGNPNNLLEVTDPGTRTLYGYDAKGNRISETDSSGNITTLAYDANNKEISRTTTRSVIVNGTPQQQSITSTRERDAEGRITKETDALGYSTTTEYNAGGQITATIDAHGRRTPHSYDTRTKLARTTWPDGSHETITYDENGNQASTTDRQGRLTQYQYDALNRLIKTIAPDGTASGTEYDAAGRVSASIDARGNRSTHTYDEAGRLKSVTTADNKTSSFAYDANGNRTSVTDANAKVTTYEFDALNRLTKTTYPDGKFSSTVWNITGAKLSETDTAGNTIAYGYDPMGRLNKVTATNFATSHVTLYGFDNLGNKTSQTDAENHTTTWEYDANNRVTARTLPGAQKETYRYDANGNLTGKTDFNGQATSTAYDTLNQPGLTVWPDGGSIVTGYTASGQVNDVTVTAGTSSLQGGKTVYSYDAQDRLVKQTNPDGSFHAYGYDNAGNIVQHSTQDGTVNATYDADNRLESVTAINGQITRYTYDILGREAGITTADGITASKQYDDNGRLLQLLHRKADGSITAGVRYTLADNGQRLKLEEFDGQSTITGNVPANPARTYDYQYDQTGRLTQDRRTDRGGAVARTSTWMHDRVGNRTTRTDITGAGTTTTAYTYDSNDRLTTEVKTPPTGSPVTTAWAWDANGNLKSSTTGTQGTFYNWNSDNRLIEARQGATQATAVTIAKYLYDANGNRVRKIEPQNGQPDKITDYEIDTNTAYARTTKETVTQGGVTLSTTLYTWGNGLIAQTRAGQQSYYRADGLGSVRALTDTSGNVTDTYQYDGSGVVENHTGATVNAFRFAGEYTDDTTGHIYLRDRWLNPATGTFVSMDRFPGAPVRPVTLNKYLYANADPVNKTDPSGNMSLGELSSAINVASTLADIATSSYDFAYSMLAPDDNEKVDANGDRKSTLWDSLMSTLIPSVMDTLSAAPIAMGAIALTGGGGTEGHHTIPKYMCGHPAQTLSKIPKALHKELHAKMYLFDEVLTIAGFAYNALFRKKKILEFKSPVKKLGQTVGGRTAIAAGLALFYYEGNYSGQGTLPIGVVLATETPKFIGTHHTCK